MNLAFVTFTLYQTKIMLFCPFCESASSLGMEFSVTKSINFSLIYVGKVLMINFDMTTLVINDI